MMGSIRAVLQERRLLCKRYTEKEVSFLIEIQLPAFSGIGLRALDLRPGALPN